MLARLAAWCLRAAGWTLVGPKPDAPKVILFGYPHTSNWDLVVYVLAAWALDVPLAWMGKHQLFRGPAGPLMQWLGGIPIHRDRRENVVSQMARAFDERGELYLVITPEGTRGRVDFLKSGFYHIALAARVPIALGLLDYATKRVGFGPLQHPSGDVHKDMDAIRAFYEGRVGLYPERAGRLRLREEDAASAESAPRSATPDR
jgi:1-acyl-sn-glycerol-3-phosphate acyltransferase